MVYIITYDLCNGQGETYQRLLELIKEDGVWARLNESTYLIESFCTVVELRDKYSQVLGNNDKLYVGLVDAPAAWHGYPRNVTNWIKEKLA